MLREQSVKKYAQQIGLNQHLTVSGSQFRLASPPHSKMFPAVHFLHLLLLQRVKSTE